MLLLLLLILPSIVAIDDIKNFIKSKEKDERPLLSMNVLALIMVIGFPLLIGMISISNIPSIKEEIEFYKEENLSIESNISALLDDYSENNEELASDINPKDYSTEELATIIITQLYPVTDFNVTVQSQIELYRSNSEKIKELKTRLIKSYSWYWWVYFKSPSKMMEKDGISDI